jgi:hypothetical protein
MAHRRHRARTPLDITRSFERSRLEDQFVAAAYEWTVPLVRRSLPSPSLVDRSEVAGRVGDQKHRPRSAGGLMT